MNLFFARLTGKLKNAEKWEKHIQQLLEDNKRYHEIENSDILKEYLELEKEVTSVRFAETKKEYTTKKYKETVEYKNYTDFLKCQKNADVVKFLEARNDEERAQYKGSMVVREYLQLKGIVEEAGFETRRLFWENENRWKQTEEYRKEARYEELKNSQDIQIYLKANDPERQKLKDWREVLYTSFLKGDLADNGFKTGFWFKNPNLKKDFSMKGEAQAYVGEKNVNIMNGIMSIICRKEAYESIVWDPKRGFVPTEFAYTSGKVNNGDTLQMEEGIFILKVRAEGACHSSVELVNETGDKMIELFHYNGKRIMVGTAEKGNVNEEALRGINSNDWYIMSVRVDKHQLTWEINGREIRTGINPLSGQKLHISVQSYAPAAKAAEGRIDVAWVRVLEKR